MATRSGFPSLTAFLGLLAIAGYQNRDKIGDLLRGAGSPAAPGAGDVGSSGHGSIGNSSGGFGGLLSGFQQAGSGGLIAGGLSELLKRFQQSGFGSTADSWVQSGPNKPTSQDELEKALGPDVIAELEEKTGLPRYEILQRLAKELPDAVDRYTPDGRLPAAS